MVCKTQQNKVHYSLYKHYFKKFENTKFESYMRITAANSPYLKFLQTQKPKTQEN